MRLNEFFEDTPNEKRLSLKRYKDLISDIRTQAYRVIAMAAELKRPHAEMKVIVDLMEKFDSNWWTLQRDIEEAEKRAK